MQIADFTMVGYTSEDNHSHIYFFEVPAYANLDEVEIRNRMQQAKVSGDLPKELKIVDHQVAVVRGQEIELVVSQGANHGGLTYRKASGVFQGRGGQAMAVFEAPVKAWNQAVLDEFLASIR